MINLSTLVGISNRYHLDVYNHWARYVLAISQTELTRCLSDGYYDLERMRVIFNLERCIRSGQLASDLDRDLSLMGTPIWVHLSVPQQ